MKLHAITIPDAAADLAPWLERHLAGPDLAALVAELTAVHGGDAGPALEEVLRGAEQRVRETGLTGLALEKLRVLLAHPQLLLELQEWLLLAESPYWERTILAAPALDHEFERGRHVARFGPTGTVRPHAPEPVRGNRAWYREAWFASLATAAAVLLAVYAYQLFTARPTVEPVATAWGWNKKDALRQDGPSDAYFNQLADGAAEWFQEKPETPAGLARRIGELRAGCSQLIILTDSQSLTAADRLWLKDHCRRWGAQLDKQRDALEAGANLEEVRAQTDAVVRELVESLRKRAQTA